MNDKQIRLVPKLRFPEFQKSAGWDVKPLQKLFTIGSGRDYKHQTTGSVPVYGSGGYMLSVDDFLYDGESVCIGRKGTINNPMFLTGKFWTVDTLFYTHSFQQCLPKFVYAIFQNIEWLKHNEAGGVPSLSKTIIEKIQTAVPGIAEQQKITDCLSSLDELIAAQARKVEALKTHKKGLMHQLFPRERETQPHLRFPEFRDAGEWEVKPLGELVELQSGFAFSSSSFGSEGRKLVTPKNFTKHGHGNFDVSVSKFTTQEVPERFVCKPGDLLVLLTDLTPTCELLGKPLLLEDRDGTVLLNQRVVKIEPSVSELEAVFLKYVFLTERYSNRITKTATGSTVKHSSNRVLQEMPLSHPALPEQQRIANCLTSLDDLITTASQELDTLKTHKKALMQQLFPSLEEAET